MHAPTVESGFEIPFLNISWSLVWGKIRNFKAWLSLFGILFILWRYPLTHVTNLIQNFSRSELPVFKISATARSTSASNQLPVFRKQTQISSIYTQLSSIKPANGLPRPVKTVKTTQIGNVASLPPKPPSPAGANNNHITIVNHRSSPELRNIRTTALSAPQQKIATGNLNAPQQQQTNGFTNGHKV